MFRVGLVLRHILDKSEGNGVGPMDVTSKNFLGVFLTVILAKVVSEAAQFQPRGIHANKHLATGRNKQAAILLVRGNLSHVRTAVGAAARDGSVGIHTAMQTAIRGHRLEPSLVTVCQLPQTLLNGQVAAQDLGLGVVERSQYRLVNAGLAIGSQLHGNPVVLGNQTLCNLKPTAGIELLDLRLQTLTSLL